MEKDKEKELGLFDNFKCSFKIDTKVITCFDTFENYVVFGDDKGMAYCYEINDKTSDCVPDHKIEVAKAKIDQLKCHATLNVVYFLISGYVYVYTIPKLEKLHKLELKDVVKFAVNSHNSRVNEIVFCTKKKRLKYMEYNHEMRKFIDSKYEESLVKEIPDLIDWYKDWMVLLNQKKSYLLKCDGKIIPIDYDGITYAKSVGSSWLMYIFGSGVLMDKNVPKSQNTITFGNKPLVMISSFKNYIISLHNTVLKVFDGNDSSNIQDVVIDQAAEGRFLACSAKKILYLVQSFDKNNPNAYFLYELKELAYEKQISKLISEEKFDDSLAILNNNISSNDEEKPKRFEQYFLDSAWVYLKKCNFINAQKNFNLANFNPVNLILLFQNELKMQITDKGLKDLINNENYSIGNITSNNNDLIKKALEMLCEILLIKRNYLMTNFLSQFSNNDFSKAMESNAKLMNFTPSDQTLIDLKNFSFTYKQNLMFINTAIIKVMIIKEYPPNKIKDIIDSENFICNEEDLNSFIISGDSNKSAKIALAYMHEKNKNYDQALSIWREFGIKREEEPVLSHEACERTKLIFTITKDKDLFKEYIGWMLEKYTESGFKIFVKLEIIQIEFFYTSIIGQVDKANPSLNLKERFLEFYIDSGCNNERYHTMICDLYLEKLFKFKKQNESLENSDIYKLEPLVKVVYDKFNAVIKNSKYYNKAHILDKIKDSWMTDIEIYLYSQLNMHESAISKLIIIGCGEENFDKVEKYCHETSSNTSNSHAGKELYGEMFKVLTNEYQKSIKGYANCKSEKEKNSASKCAELLKKQMYNVLKKYGDSQKLDVFQVLELIPSDWLLTDQILYDYLVKVIKNSNHMSNKYKLAKSLSEMSLLYKEKELIEVKSKSVQIGNDTNCESCKKKIGTTIFVVYPNMKIYHTKCTQNFNICPTTRVDFSKKKYA